MKICDATIEILLRQHTARLRAILIHLRSVYSLQLVNLRDWDVEGRLLAKCEAFPKEGLDWCAPSCPVEWRLEGSLSRAVGDLPYGALAMDALFPLGRCTLNLPSRALFQYRLSCGILSRELHARISHTIPTFLSRRYRARLAPRYLILYYLKPLLSGLWTLPHHLASHPFRQ